ncbi:hypothetical protein J3E69DRAFT_6357 [Trichoderma sp. SZMC 28015]
MVACALLTRTLLYMQYCAVQTSPKHDIPACQSVPGWDGMGCFLQNCTPSSYSVLHRRHVTYICLHVHGMQCSIQGCTCSDVRLLNFVGLLLRAMPCHSPHPAHPIGISKYPSPIVRPQFCFLCCLSLCCFFVYSG